MATNASDRAEPAALSTTVTSIDGLTFMQAATEEIAEDRHALELLAQR